PAAATRPQGSTRTLSSKLSQTSSLRLLCRCLLLGATLAAAFGGALVAAQESRRQLVDQILQYERILHELDAVALLQILLVAARRDADVLPAEQSGRHDARIAVLRDAVELRVDSHAYHCLVLLLVVADVLDAPDGAACHRNGRAGLQAADVLEQCHDSITLAVGGKFAVGDLGHQKKQRRKAEQHEQAGGKFYGAGRSHNVPQSMIAVR